MLLSCFHVFRSRPSLIFISERVRQVAAAAAQELRNRDMNVQWVTCTGRMAGLHVGRTVWSAEVQERTAAHALPRSCARGSSSSPAREAASSARTAAQ